MTDYCDYCTSHIERTAESGKKNLIYRKNNNLPSYCSRACAWAMQKLEKNKPCLYCGFLFTNLRSSALFCSRSCTAAKRAKDKKEALESTKIDHAIEAALKSLHKPKLKPYEKVICNYVTEEVIKPYRTTNKPKE
jgi:hypothetical protein